MKSEELRTTATVLLVLVSIAGLSFVLARPHAQTSAPALPAVPTEQVLWEALVSDMQDCDLQSTRELLSNPDYRKTALFAAARFNCADIAGEILGAGVELDETRIVESKAMSVSDYARSQGASEVEQAVQRERARREEEVHQVAAVLESRKKTLSENEQQAGAKERDELRSVMEEEAALRSSIHYDRARLACEVLRARLGNSAYLVSMNECIKAGIEQRRAERGALGHHVPP